jgi:hypothetical protein
MSLAHWRTMEAIQQLTGRKGFWLDARTTGLPNYMSHPLLETIAFGMALADPDLRSRMGPEIIRDEELQILFLAMRQGEHELVMKWFRQFGVGCDAAEKGKLGDKLIRQLERDAEHERTLDAMHEMLQELRERKERREVEERG